jgi:hypothetical protein
MTSQPPPPTSACTPPSAPATCKPRLLDSGRASGLARGPADSGLVAALLIAVNPDEDSRLPYLLRVPQPGGDLLFRTSGTWPRVKALDCYPVGLDDWPTDAVIVERLPLRSCQRRGAAIDVILQRSRENRSQLVFTTARGRDAVLWQSPRTRKQARPNVRTPTARAHGIEEVQILATRTSSTPTSFAPSRPAPFSGRCHAATTASSSMGCWSPAWNANPWSIWSPV